jgi:GNAT superfamily N-acetyltransferase
MRISPARVPRLLGVLVIAFAPYEDRPLLGAAELFRGIAIQLSYRWAAGQIVADQQNRAVLLWSVAFGTPRPIHRQLLGVLMATSVGIALLIVGNGLLLIPLGLIFVAIGVGSRVVIDIGLGIIGARLLVTSWRAFLAYQNESMLTARLPAPATLRWRIDYLAAVPPRSGQGGKLLDGFLDHADENGAEVVLHCQMPTVAFYRRHGFHLVGGRRPDGQSLMLRPARTRSPHPHRNVVPLAG